MRPASRIWGPLAAVSGTALVVIFESFMFVAIAKTFAPVALGQSLYWAFLTDIPQSTIGREYGYLVVNVIGVPGLNTPGHGNDPFLMLEDHYPPFVLPSVVIGLIFGLGTVYLIAKKQRDREIQRGGLLRSGWRSASPYVMFAIISLGLAIGLACVWELLWMRGAFQ
jgi:hypothetical protein